MKKLIFILFFLLKTGSIFSQDDKSNCEIFFSFNLYDNHLSLFTHKVVNGGDRISSYFWDFGDGYTSQLANPHHVFLHEGEYVTCLTVTFENNCIATYCDTIVVENPLLEPNQNYGISGYVYAGNALLPEGVIILFRKINNEFKAIAYTKINQGTYSFNNLIPAQYWLYAIPYFNVNTLFYPNYFPTYYGNKLLWQDATPITVSGLHSGKNIHLLASHELFLGNDSVFGKVIISDSTNFEYNVYLCNWFGNTLPPQNNLNCAPNQVILLADGQNKVQRFALTNYQGEFIFKNIPKQIVKLRPEKFGVTSQTFNIDMSQQQYVEFILNPTSIVIQVEEIAAPQQLSLNVYPNPASSHVFVQITNQNLEGDIFIELLNMQGSAIYSQAFINNGQETYFIPLNGLPAGIYIISVRSEKEMQKFVLVKN